MGADQQFCLRWNNFHTNITSAFESLRDDEDFVDITLACEGRQIKAHKMVLSACSPYFRSLLRGNPCQHPIVFLKDVTFANLTSILDFMYHGEVNVSHNELATFLKTAEALRVRGLAEDDKKKDGDTCTESSSPPPPRDPPEPCSPRPDEPPDGGGGRASSVRDTMPSSVRSTGGASADSGDYLDAPPAKRQRRRSGATPSHHSADQDSGTATPGSGGAAAATNSSSNTGGGSSGGELLQSDAVRDAVKNEPEDYINDDDNLSQQTQHLGSEDIKLDGFNTSSNADESSDYNIASESVSISSRSQAAMQQLQESFSSFIPGITAQTSSGSGFLPHSSQGSGGDHSRSHPSFSLEGVQGLPPGISALPGPSSMSQGGSSSSSQDASAQEAVSEFLLSADADVIMMGSADDSFCSLSSIGRSVGVMTDNSDLKMLMALIEEQSKKIDELQTTVALQTKKINRLCDLMLDNGNTIKEDVPEFPPPASTLEELKEIKDHPAMISQIRLMMDKTVLISSRRIIRKIMSKTLAQQFSMTGMGERRIKNKYSFKDHPICRPIVNAIKGFHDAPEDEVYHCLGNVLRSARDWDGGRTIRKSQGGKPEYDAGPSAN